LQTCQWDGVLRKVTIQLETNGAGLRRRRHGVALGFTLIELMIAVCIIGVLASIAIPGFKTYMMAARGAEVPANLSTMYKSAVAYWDKPLADRGLGATASGHCLIQTCCGGATSAPPLASLSGEKQIIDWSTVDGFNDIGFAPSGGVYAGYAIDSYASDVGFAGTCGVTADMFDPEFGNVYQFIGVTDLDADGIYGGQVLMVGIRGEELFRAPGWSSLNDYLGGACPFCAEGFID
jgi:prepilin-type N-terminal cleavage/methylation domain-containing protein